MSHHVCLVLLLWHQLLISAAIADRQYFVSTSHIAQLPTMQNRLAETLLGYADNETVRLDRLRKFARDLSQQDGANVTSAPDAEISQHPVEAFLIIKRMGQDWRRLLGDCSGDVDSVLKSSGLELPTLEDYEGAIDALLRLQDVYGISAESMARGQLTVGSGDSEANRSAPVLLSASDCVHLVRRAFNRSLDLLALDWLRLVLFSDALEPAEKAAAVPAMLEALHGRFQADQSKKTAHYMVGYLWEYVGHNITKFEENIPNVESALERIQDIKNYKKLCKDGSFIKPNASTSHLVCRLAVPHPFFTLAPLKEELLNADPWVVFLYDVLTDAESNRLMQVADPLLQRAGTVGSRKSKIRISKSAFLKDGFDWSVRNINRKLASVTGLNISDSDYLQLGNYGIGGQYEPHMDSFKHEITRGNNRVATVLLYLNNVEQGGATVFPRLGLRVMPVKNGALFWYNLRRDSSEIKETLHAACPVLEGSKWVANKWIYYLGQMHHRPCSLSEFD